MSRGLGRTQEWTFVRVNVCFTISDHRLGASMFPRGISVWRVSNGHPASHSWVTADRVVIEHTDQLLAVACSSGDLFILDRES